MSLSDDSELLKMSLVGKRQFHDIETTSIKILVSF